MTEAEETTQPEAAGGRRFNAVTILRIVLLIAPWAFIAYLYRDTGEIEDAFEDATPALLVVALVFILAAVSGVGVTWVALVKHLGGAKAAEIDGRALLRTYARSWIARYIPGVAWTYGARFVHTKEGISRRVMAASMVNEFMMMAAVTTSIGVGLWLWGAVNVWLGIAALAATLPLCVFVATHVNRLAHWALDHVGRLLPKRFKNVAEELDAGGDRVDLSPGEAARFSAAFTVVALVSGLSFFFVLLSLTDVGADEIPRAIGAYNLATIISIAVIFVPAGLGVREASLAALVTPIVSGPVAATAALAFRVITLVADGIFLLVAELIASGRRDRRSV
jgi:uncharacterized membrane protein YbhN (UPF0104 family)